MKKKLTSLLALSFFAAASAVAQSISVTLKEAGSLADSIPEDKRYTMTSLTIAGPINGDDVKFLRDIMSVEKIADTPKGKLATLNLKEARIVPGGQAYYEGIDGNNRPVAYRTRTDTIGSRMFLNCVKLRSIQLPETTVYLDSLSFCFTAITTMRMPETVKGIGLGAFESCRNMTTFTPNEACESYGTLCFYYCEKLTRFVFPDGVKELGPAMFNYCDGLTYVKLPASIEEIPMMMFENTHALSTVMMPTELKRVGNRAFMYSSEVRSLPLPEGLEYIGEYAFAGASKLSNCTVPASVTEIGPLSFTGCWTLGGIKVSEDNPYYTTIDGSLFSKDGSVMYQYYNGFAIDSLVVPEGVEEIAYEGCGYSYDLKHIVLPESLLLINALGIDFCYQLQDVMCKAVTPPDCVGKAFDSQIINNCTLYVPSKSLSDYRKATVWKDFKSIKPIPGSGEDTGINSPSKVSTQSAGFYDLSGRRILRPVEGVSLERLPDGTTRKVYR